MLPAVLLTSEFDACPKKTSLLVENQPTGTLVLFHFQIQTEIKMHGEGQCLCRHSHAEHPSP